MALSCNSAMNAATPPQSKPKRTCLKGCLFGCAGSLVIFITLIVGGFALLNRVPKSYPPLANPLPPPAREDYARYRLDGFESPYLGHTGSWDGQGGTMTGGSKADDLDKEVAMGLRWTFMCVNWRRLEPNGPVDLEKETPASWRALDQFVIEAHKRKLNILFQAPVVGGNAEGPPDWAGRREPGKSAPQNIDAAAEFAGKLAARYKPGGTLASSQSWDEKFGVRAWELDNEPEMYRTHWKNQAGDYAEFATKVSAKIKAVDPLALIVLPGVASGNNKTKWLPEALDAHRLAGSPVFRQTAKPYSIGPLADAVSFHVYEGLDSVFHGSPRTVEVIFGEVRSEFEQWETNSAGFHYARKQEYWHTEGNFDFIGALSGKRRAAWRLQFFTRAFAAGVRKVCVMDAAPIERIAIKNYTETLPWPFPMEPANAAAKVTRGQASIFRHKSNNQTTWIAWALPGPNGAIVQLPMTNRMATFIDIAGVKTSVSVNNNQFTIDLPADEKMPAPIIVLDRN